jgi:hypothetical protein
MRPVVSSRWAQVAETSLVASASGRGGTAIGRSKPRTGFDFFLKPARPISGLCV